MQLFKRRRLSPVFLMLFLCYAAFSKMSYAQFGFAPDPGCGGGGVLFSISGGCNIPVLPPETPTSAPSSSSTSYLVSSSIGIRLAPYTQPDIGFNLSLLVFLEVYESVNNASYTKVSNANPSSAGNTITRQVPVSGTVRYRYRACNSNECSEYSPVLTLSITQPPTGGTPSNARRVVFLHADALGSPAAETNENGAKQ